jgi:hypothetical protein
MELSPGDTKALAKASVSARAFFIMVARALLLPLDFVCFGIAASFRG